MTRGNAKEGKKLCLVLLICFKDNYVKVLAASYVKTSTRTAKLLGKGCM